jgi:hypothetical protein
VSDAHLSTSELVRWRDAGVGDRGRIVAHLATCAVCRHAAAELERNSPAESVPARFDPKDYVQAGYRAGARTPQTRSTVRLAYLAAAAVILLAAAILPLWLRDRSDSALRGGAAAVVLVRPVDATVAVQDLVFEWKAEPGADRFHLTIVAIDEPGKPLIDREVSGNQYTPTDEERARLRPGRALHWFVEYRDPGGGTGTSPAARFTLR